MDRYEEDRQSIRDSVSVKLNLSSLWRRFDLWVTRWRQRRAWKRYLRKHYPKRKLP